VLAFGLRFGPYGPGIHPFKKGVTLAALRRAPHGIDLGPLVPRLPERLFTKTKRIDLAPRIFVDDLARARAAFFEEPPPAAPEALLLIGRRQVRTNNSWMGHIERLTRGKATCTVLIHTQDAAARGINTGDLVRIRSAVGSIELPATVVDGIMPGVVSVPHGFGHGREGARLGIAPRAQGVSVNDLTDGSVVDQLSGNAVLNGVPVQLEVVSGGQS
jgi:anaerobic selenocysteine-containing dehydrogenase